MGEKMGNAMSRQLVEITLLRLKECVKSDRYIIYDREKNLDFTDKYRLTRKQEKDILLGIKVEDYWKTGPSLVVPDTYVHEFFPQIQLENPDGKTEKITLYLNYSRS